MDEKFRNIGRMRRKAKKYPYRKIMIPKSSGYESMSACVSNGRASLQVRLPILSARRNEPKKRLSKTLSKANSENLKKMKSENDNLRRKVPERQFKDALPLVTKISTLIVRIRGNAGTHCRL